MGCDGMLLAVVSDVVDQVENIVNPVSGIQPQLCPAGGGNNQMEEENSQIFLSSLPFLSASWASSNQ